MPLRFPAVEDIPLGRPPLADVICQVRFPTVLRIARGQPAEFQDGIRKRFPELEEQRNVQFRVAAEAGPQSGNAELLGRSFQFRSRDGQTVVSLTADSYALSTAQYTVWDEFARDLELVHQTAMAVYELPYAHRIGLRYVNMLDSERTGHQSLDEIKGFLHPELTSWLTTSGWDTPDELVSQVLLADGNGQMVIRLAIRGELENQSPLILLDFDYYEEGQLALGDLIERCTHYHDVIYRAFRWAIQPDKLTTFELLPNKE
jgi:uncharacterized protein (TIGR04255 family)